MATTTTLTQLSVPKLNAGAVGDRFILDDGVHDHSSDETISRSGIIFIAKNPGKAIIKGAPIHISGQSVVQEAFELQYSSTAQTVCTLSGANTKFLNNKIRFGNPTSNRNDWFVFKADSILLQGNDIEGKIGQGNEILLLPSSGRTAKNCKIINNRLSKHTGGSANGTEILRIGNSTIAAQEFNCEVAGNKFEYYNAYDSELITVKTSGNDIHDNEFLNCKTGPCFRHGRNNKFRNNKCIGSGLRIYGKGHEVTGNTFTRIPLSQLRQIVIGNGQYAEEEQNTSAGYTQVRDLLFENNIIDLQDSTDDIGLCLGYGSYSLKPINNKIINNTILGSKGTLANTTNGASWSNNTVSGNKMWATGTAKYGDMPISGYVKEDPNIVIPPPTPLTLEERIIRLESAVFGVN